MICTMIECNWNIWLFVNELNVFIDFWSSFIRTFECCEHLFGFRSSPLTFSIDKLSRCYHQMSWWQYYFIIFTINVQNIEERMRWIDFSTNFVFMSCLADLFCIWTFKFNEILWNVHHSHNNTLKTRSQNIAAPKTELSCNKAKLQYIYLQKTLGKLFLDVIFSFWNDDTKMLLKMFHSTKKKRNYKFTKRNSSKSN